MEDKEYRQKIVDLLKINNLFAVMWDGHASRYYCLMSNYKKSIKKYNPEIYSAIYESFYDINGKELHRCKFSYDDKKCWKDFYDMTVKHLKTNKKYKIQ